MRVPMYIIIFKACKNVDPDENHADEKGQLNQRFTNAQVVDNRYVHA
jgi:hypothetical protein